ncbi:MAG: protoporphyrinogen oxidase [Polyangiaceae bacterium]|nr:protoporphyrinogen oxidase [Polyangiaceae bacterium]
MSGAIQRGAAASGASGPLDVLIVGGGVAGLAAAFELRQRSPGARVLVLEARERLGGNVRTLERDGCIVDLGPDALATQPGEALALCEALGLSGELQPPSDASRRVSIAHRGALHPMPEGLAMGLPRSPLALASTSLISPLGKLRAALDLLLPAGRSGDTSLGGLVRRRLGAEVHENLVAPLVGGIYGGDPDRLDVRVVMPMLAQTQGSLVRALARAPRPAGGMIKAPRRGMQRLVDALTEQLGEERLRHGVPALRARRREGLWCVEIDGGETLETRHLVLAMPAHAAAALLGEEAPGLAAALAEIQARSSASVVLAFNAGDTPEPDSSGFLVSRREPVCFQAATFAGRKWPGRVRSGRVVVRAVVDAERAPGLLDQGDLVVARRVLSDLRAYGRFGEPAWSHVARHEKASPLPEVGHPERVARARSLAEACGALSLVGASYDGPGLAGCARGAARVAAALS